MRSLRRVLPPVVAMMAMALALAACGGDAEEPATQAAARPSQTSQPAGAHADGTAGAGPQGAAAGAGARARPDALGGLQPAAGDLSNFSCEQRGGVWSAGGVLSNSAEDPMVYTVTVVTLAGTEVAGHAADELLLEPGESTPFALPRVGRGDADGCMPRVVRTPR